jgi:hypothetical protein
MHDVELAGEVPGEGGGREALSGEESTDTVAHAGASGLEGKELAMEVACVLGLGRGGVDDGPDASFAVVIADEHGEELGGVDTVGLDAAAAALDVDRGGVDDEVVTAGLRGEETVEPEPIAAGFVAGKESDGAVEMEATAGRVDLPNEGVKIAGRDGAQSGLLAETRAEGQFPGAVGQLEGEIQGGWLGQSQMSRAGRRGHDAPPCGIVSSLEGNLRRPPLASAVSTSERLASPSRIASVREGFSARACGARSALLSRNRIPKSLGGPLEEPL